MTLQLSHVNNGTILPDGSLLLGESMATDQFFLCWRVYNGAQLEFGVHCVGKYTIGGVSKGHMTICCIQFQCTHDELTDYSVQLLVVFKEADGGEFLRI